MSERLQGFRGAKVKRKWCISFCFSCRGTFKNNIDLDWIQCLPFDNVALRKVSKFLHLPPLKNSESNADSYRPLGRIAWIHVTDYWLLAVRIWREHKELIENRVDLSGEMQPRVLVLVSEELSWILAHLPTIYYCQTSTSIQKGDAFWLCCLNVSKNILIEPF